MKKYYILLMTIATVGIFSSCTKDDFSGDDQPTQWLGSAMKIGDVSISDAQTRAVAQPKQLPEITCGDMTLSVTETITPITGPMTRGVVMNATTLQDNTFTLKGYLDKNIDQKIAASDADKKNKNFMNTTVSYSNGGWHTSSEYLWRLMTNHYFWAYYGTTSDFEVVPEKGDKQYAEASFTYTNTAGEEDFLVARHMQYCEAEDDKQYIDKLSFDHALAAVKSEARGITFEEYTDDTKTTTQPSDRGSVTDIEIVSLNSGKCTVNNDGSAKSIAWGNHGTEKVGVSSFGNNAPGFVIPQEKTNSVVNITIYDSQRQYTRSYQFKEKAGTTQWGTGTWDAGWKYYYNFSGKFILPYLPGGSTGIDFNFKGKDGDHRVIDENIDATYIKKIKVSWDGVPTTDGNGTLTLICLVPSDTKFPEAHTKKENWTDYFVDGANGRVIPKANNPEIGFAYDPFHPVVTHIGTVGNPQCSTVEFYLDAIATYLKRDVTSYKLVAIYCGGSGGGSTQWTATNVNVEITQWR